MTYESEVQWGEPETHARTSPGWVGEALTFNTINKLGEETMEEDKGAALYSTAQQYELVADLLRATYTYAGALGRKEMMAAFATAFDTLDNEFDDDFERVDEPDEARFDFAANRPGTPVNLLLNQPQEPYGGKHRESEN